MAAPWGGQLRYVANVRTGFTDQERLRLAALLATRGRSRPVVRCPHPGLWVEPDLICLVNYLEWTRAGRLRGASFHGWHQDLSSSWQPLANFPHPTGRTHDQV